jgi:cell division cycle 20-like protein 1 (cofactor of APC complex)
MILTPENKTSEGPTDPSDTSKSDNSPISARLRSSRSPQRRRTKSQQRVSLHIDTGTSTSGNSTGSSSAENAYHGSIPIPSNMHHDTDCSMEVPPSPCATSTTSSPPTPSGSIGSSYSGKFSISYPPRGEPRILPSSPRRPALDYQYASRLFEPAKDQEMNDSILMPPPSVYHNHGSTTTPSRSVRRTSMEMMNSASASTSMYSDYHTPVNSIGGASVSAQTPLCTPDKSPRSNSSRSGEDVGSLFSFYTPKRSPRGMTGAGHQITFSSPSRSNLSPQRSTKKATTPTSNDRFIPSRATSNLKFSVWDSDFNEKERTDHSNSNRQSDLPNEDDGTPRQEQSPGQNQSSQPPLLNMLLRSEVLGENIDPAHSSSANNVQFVSPSQRGGENRNPLTEGGNYLRYNCNQRQAYHDNIYGDVGNDPTAIVDSFSLSPVRMSSNHRLMSMPQKPKRKIAKVPFKVLDAPALADDFYLNLVDWSSQNVLAVGLGTCVYLWSACTSKVTKLCDLSESNVPGSSQEAAAVTSVAWTQKGTHLAVGVNNGEVQFWDTVKCKKIRMMGGHTARIGALSWSGPTLASGSRDRLIYLRDMRVSQPFTARLASHKQEVCGLKWSYDEPSYLASGGNDNKLLVWDIKNHRQEAHRFSEHTAAVKAIAWSPHQHGLLASGGGTADRCIRFWNALSGSPLNAIDTGSQVCNLAWSRNCNEIVSTHGYSLNQIALWKYPTMQKVATLTGHTYRVLYLAMSPDGSTIVTGAGDETLRFWQVFPGPRSNNKNGKNGLLFPSSPFSVLR